MSLVYYRDEPVELWDVYVLRETSRAILVQIDNADVWVPKSVLHDDSEVREEGDEGILIVHYWWAEKHGLAG